MFHQLVKEKVTSKYIGHNSTAPSLEQEINGLIKHVEADTGFDKAIKCSKQVVVVVTVIEVLEECLEQVMNVKGRVVVVFGESDEV